MDSDQSLESQTQAAARRRFALEVVTRLRSAGFQALWAGGCVRDQLMGLTPKDYDVATDALPTQIQDVFGRKRTHAVGAAFGVITVLGPKPAGQVEVATFRQDATYSDGRHPDAITFSDPETDAQRRDFTINGLFFDPLTNIVRDYVGGQQDLQAQVIRAIGIPQARFTEDKLRLLRAIRFATRFGYQIESDTWKAICELSSQVNVVSPERISTELRLTLPNAQRVAAWNMLRDSGLLMAILPELARADEPTWQRSMQYSGQLVAPSFSLALATALLPLEADGLGRELAQRWRLSNIEQDRITWLLRHGRDLFHAEQRPWSSTQRLVAHEGAKELIALTAAQVNEGSIEATLSFLRERAAWPLDQKSPPPLLTGNDLLAAGFASGPAFRQLLESVRNAQLDDQIKTPDEALELAKQLYLGAG